MRVCIDASPAVYRRAGIGRYTQELTTALLDMDIGNEYVAFFNRSAEAQIKPPFDRMPHIPITLSDKPWRLRVLLSYVAHLSQQRMFPGIDLFHATDHLLPYLPTSKSVFSLYDVSFRLYPRTHKRGNRWFLSLMMPYFLQCADVVVAISHATRRDAVNLYGVDEAKIRVIYLGVDPSFEPVNETDRLQEICRKYKLPARFFLYVGTIEPRKNLVTLFDAFSQADLPDLKLVIAGRTGWLYDEILERSKQTGLVHRIVFTGYVPDEDLPGLYSLAEAFIFPSLYEGFGLPVLEAMACGTPVVCSNASSLPEVAGNAALLIEPKDVRVWGQVLEQIAGNAALRADLRQRGLRQASRFTWQAVAQQTAQVYQEVYERHGRCSDVQASK